MAPTRISVVKLCEKWPLQLGPATVSTGKRKMDVKGKWKGCLLFGDFRLITIDILQCVASIGVKQNWYLHKSIYISKSVVNTQSKMEHKTMRTKQHNTGFIC